MRKFTSVTCTTRALQIILQITFDYAQVGKPIYTGQRPIQTAEFFSANPHASAADRCSAATSRKSSNFSQQSAAAACIFCLV